MPGINDITSVESDARRALNEAQRLVEALHDLLGVSGDDTSADAGGPSGDAEAASRAEAPGDAAAPAPSDSPDPTPEVRVSIGTFYGITPGELAQNDFTRTGY